MPSGHCFCGEVKIEYTGVPSRSATSNSTKALCHCDNCRHYTGSTYSHNIVVPSANFKVTGTPKEIAVIAASGKSITNCFCGNCGTTLYRYGDTFGGIDGDRIIQAGVLDHLSDLNANKPRLEMFEDRAEWVHSLEDEDVSQFKGMPPSPPKI